LSDTLEVPVAPLSETHPRVSWLSADRGLWVATGLSERNTRMHLGRIDHMSSGYAAYDRIGASLGSFATLGEAKAQVELHS